MCLKITRCFKLTVLLFAFQILLEQAREKKAKAMNPFEHLREKIMSYLHSTFTTYLNSRPMQWNGFYRIFFFDDVDLVKQRLIGAPRNATQVALRSPNQYLEVIEFICHTFVL